MENRAIVLAEMEQSQTTLERERELDLQFRLQWKLVEEYPACPLGLTLLRRFAEAYPQLYDNFVVRNPSGHQSLPALGRNPVWTAYRQRLGMCDDCMEGREDEKSQVWPNRLM